MTELHRVAKALSDPVRIRILDLLVAGRDEECCSPRTDAAPRAICACDMRPSLDDIAPSRLSYHLRELREAGLITEQKRGKWVYHSLRREGLAAWMQELSRRFLGTAAFSATATGPAPGAGADPGGATAFVPLGALRTAPSPPAATPSPAANAPPAANPADAPEAPAGGCCDPQWVPVDLLDEAPDQQSR